MISFNLRVVRVYGVFVRYVIERNHIIDLEFTGVNVECGLLVNVGAMKRIVFCVQRTKIIDSDLEHTVRWTREIDTPRSNACLSIFSGQ